VNLGITVPVIARIEERGRQIAQAELGIQFPAVETAHYLFVDTGRFSRI
jgi:hypothetical protein